MKSQQVIAAVKHDHWSCVRGKHDDDPFVFRYRNGLYNVTDFTGYSRLLIVTWTYFHDGCTGIPSQDESSELKDLENLLVESFEHDFHAVLASVLTERGTRRWYFYTSDMSECERRVNQMPQKPERYPIELVAKTDADWSCFHDMIETICRSAD